MSLQASRVHTVAISGGVVKFTVNSVAAPLIAVAVLALGAPTASATGSGEPRIVPAGGALLASGPVRMAPQPPQLSEEEKQAVANEEAGRDYDRKAFNRAEQKRIQAEKYNGDRNKQKRRK